MSTKLIPILIATALGACTGRGYYSASATVATPAPRVDLAYVAPGVHVIANYDEPIFYSNGSYWYYADGLWYRSHDYTRGWVYVSTPPRALLSVRSPYAYVRYRPQGYVTRYRPVPSHRIERPVVRDHRARRVIIRRR